MKYEFGFSLGATDTLSWLEIASLASPIIAGVAVVFSLCFFIFQRRDERLKTASERHGNAWNLLYAQFNLINEAGKNSGIDVSLASTDIIKHKKWLTKHSTLEHRKACVQMLYHNMNLYHMAYLFRKNIGEGDFSSIDNWSRKILAVWIDAVPETWPATESILRKNDLYNSDFVEYLRAGTFRRHWEEITLHGTIMPAPTAYQRLSTVEQKLTVLRSYHQGNHI